MEQITAEQLKSMTPEQIRELQIQNCIFCHMVNGRVQSRKIYEDEYVFATLDINPANPGHILLLPKEHYSIMPQIPSHIISHMFMVAKALSNATLRALRCQGTNIFVANGVAAGQKAPHFMIHIIPRKDADSLTSFNLKVKEISEKSGEIVAEKLRKLNISHSANNEQEHEKNSDHNSNSDVESSDSPEHLTHAHNHSTHGNNHLTHGKNSLTHAHNHSTSGNEHKIHNSQVEGNKKELHEPKNKKHIVETNKNDSNLHDSNKNDSNKNDSTENNTEDGIPLDTIAKMLGL